ncbi:hypothetical protein IW140_000396 [Coemansia sp. RSA 1813]|nr:hypothetical protein EV178_000645 [Coemansia sp. RSA 1646]KAJ1773269.1 hypothetical protein LPJ74_000779 [Coemansia sp. RSA 1843]KAJ2092736.1 hypothetical protein IW138_000830 [Coemansia sp. RSA 986]KAJ2217765.1 hypothetical protein EV179_000251 [Coemansia sp. RSA 487]KAJ2572998.1 hypothetical protein IW140_000396 [Coemansia sp. RSA 1813]
MVLRAMQRFRTSVAPMVDVTDPCFLRLLRLISPFGNHQLWTEMIHANTFSRGKMHHDRTKLAYHVPVTELHDFADGIVVQLGASQPSDAYEAVHALASLGVRHVNLNCGCPSRNVQMGAFGAVLMKTPEETAQIVRAMVQAACEAEVAAAATTTGSHGMAISVKCRIGIDDNESLGFLENFVSSVTEAGGSSVDLVVHARRAWLAGLSPKENRTVPQLNHTRVYEVAAKFPHVRISLNGGIDTVDAVAQHLQSPLIASVMIGRKIREDPWFLALLDQNIYGVPEAQIPKRARVLDQYLGFADAMHEDIGVRYSVFGRPLYAFFTGRKGRAMRAHMCRLFAQARKQAAGQSSGAIHQYAVPFSQIVREAEAAAEAEYIERQARATVFSNDASVQPAELVSEAVSPG